MKSLIYFSLIILSHLSLAQMTFDDEHLQKIYDYRTQVEENAFRDTMRLCVSYRKARGLSLPLIHHRGYLSQHKDPAISEWAHQLDDEYGTFESASLQSWMKIILEGSQQPFSALLGLKANYNELNNSYLATPFALETIFEKWFVSLYSLFLIQSDGFFRAALHCLGDLSMNGIGEEIDSFAFTILLFDSQAGGLTYNVFFWTGEFIFSSLLKGVTFALAPAFRPVSRTVIASAKKWNKSIDNILQPRFSNYQVWKKVTGYSTLVLGAGTGIYLGSNYWREKNRERQELEERFQDLIIENPEFNTEEYRQEENSDLVE